MFSAPFLTIVATLLVALLSLVGSIFLALRAETVKRLVRFLVSFAAGALLANVFLHLLPEVAAESEGSLLGFSLVLAGMLLSFTIEHAIHWHHCHVLPPEARHRCHSHIGVINLVGDGIHNFADGALIAGAFLVDIPAGFATALAVAFHEVPQEIGDFAILLHGGFSPRRALWLNLLSGSTILLGAAAVLLASGILPVIGMVLLPIAAGNFLYLAGADLLPELHKEVRWKAAIIQFGWMLAGIAVIASLLLFGGGHSHEVHEHSSLEGLAE